METTNTYQIKDSQTGRILPRVYATSREAYRAADRMDRQYGAVRFVVIFL